MAISRLILIAVIIASSGPSFAQSMDKVAQAQSFDAQKSAMSDVLTQQVCPSNLVEYKLIDVKQACWWSLPATATPTDLIKCENAKQEANEVISAYNLFVMRCRYHVPPSGAYSPPAQAPLGVFADRWNAGSVPVAPVSKPKPPPKSEDNGFLEFQRRLKKACDQSPDLCYSN